MVMARPTKQDYGVTTQARTHTLTTFTFQSGILPDSMTMRPLGVGLRRLLLQDVRTADEVKVMQEDEEETEELDEGQADDAIGEDDCGHGDVEPPEEDTE